MRLSRNSIARFRGDVPEFVLVNINENKLCVFFGKL